MSHSTKCAAHPDQPREEVLCTCGHDSLNPVQQYMFVYAKMQRLSAQADEIWDSMLPRERAQITGAVKGPHR